MTTDFTALMNLAVTNPAAFQAEYAKLTTPNLHAGGYVAPIPAISQPVMAPVIHTPQPVAIPQQQAAPNMADIERMLDEKLKGVMPMLNSAMGQLEGIFKRALTAQEFDEFMNYLKGGAKGFEDLVKSDKLLPVVQLMWETMKESIPK